MLRYYGMQPESMYFNVTSIFVQNLVFNTRISAIKKRKNSNLKIQFCNAVTINSVDCLQQFRKALLEQLSSA